MIERSATTSPAAQLTYEQLCKLPYYPNYSPSEPGDLYREWARLNAPDFKCLHDPGDDLTPPDMDIRFEGEQRLILQIDYCEHGRTDVQSMKPWPSERLEFDIPGWDDVGVTLQVVPMLEICPFTWLCSMEIV